jgi:translation elongation factor EF-Ts
MGNQLPVSWQFSARQQEFSKPKKEDTGTIAHLKLVHVNYAGSQQTNTGTYIKDDTTSQQTKMREQLQFSSQCFSKSSKGNPFRATGTNQGQET